MVQTLSELPASTEKSGWRERFRSFWLSFFGGSVLNFVASWDDGATKTLLAAILMLFAIFAVWGCSGDRSVDAESDAASMKQD